MVLSLYGNICRLDKSSIQYRLAARQLLLKSFQSNSWFIDVRKITMNYDLPAPYQSLEVPPTKLSWKIMVHKKFNSYWEQKIKYETTFYPSLQHLSVNGNECGKPRQLLGSTRTFYEIPRIREKLKMAVGVYILQVNRAAFNPNNIDPTCMLCHLNKETLGHCILNCTELHHLNLLRTALDILLSHMINPV